MSRLEHWKSVFSKQSPSEVHKIQNPNYKVNIISGSRKYEVIVLGEPIDLPDFHQYLKAYFKYMGWEPWKELDLSYPFQDDIDDDVTSGNLKEALTAGTLKASGY